MENYESLKLELNGLRMSKFLFCQLMFLFVVLITSCGSDNNNEMQPELKGRYLAPIFTNVIEHRNIVYGNAKIL